MPWSPMKNFFPGGKKYPIAPNGSDGSNEMNTEKWPLGLAIGGHQWPWKVHFWWSDRGESLFGADLGEKGKGFNDEQRVIQSLLS